MYLPDFLLGIHDEPEAAALPGHDFWTVIAEETGINTNARGRDYARVPGTPIVRLNHGYGTRGTLPAPDLYPQWAESCRSWVDSSNGCHLWIIANEWNLAAERPEGRPITPQDYARAYTLARSAIKALPHHADDLVLLAAVGPWNTETTYHENPSGDWLAHLLDVLHTLNPFPGRPPIDGLAIHTYTRSNEPSSITSDTKMAPPYQDRHADFRQYRDQLDALPPWALDLPIFITECCPTTGWTPEGANLITTATQDVQQWNATHRTQIRALCFYRWQPHDRWHMPSPVKDAIRHAIARRPGYRPTTMPTQATPEYPRATTNPLAAAIAATIRPEIRINPSAALYRAGTARHWTPISNETTITIDGARYVAQEWEDPATAVHYYLAAEINAYATILVLEAPVP